MAHQHPQGPKVNKDGEYEWDHGMCNCCADGCGTCMLGTFLPCVLVGRTSDMLRHPEKSQPSGNNTYGWATCGLLVCGLGICAGILSGMQREEIRGKFKLQGGSCGDFTRNICCECCAVIQQYKQVKTHYKKLVVTQQYQTQQGMAFPQQPMAVHH